MSALYSRRLRLKVRIESVKKLVLIILLLSTAARADIKVMGDGEQLIWFNNSQTFSINASSSMSESVNYIWPVADASSGGQALLSDGSGLLSWGTPTTSSAHNILSGTHDATTNAVTRGSIIYGNSTPKWDELVIGANQTFLKSDGTDAAWSTITLGTNTSGNYVAEVADGTGIDGTATGEGSIYTPIFDSTELDALTWSDGSNASNIWTFDVSGTDHTMTAGSGVMTLSHNLTVADTVTTANLKVSNLAQIGDGGVSDFMTIEADGDTHWDGDGGLIVGSMYIPGVDIIVATGDANPHEVKDDGTTSEDDGWTASALNEITFPTGGTEHYLTVSKIGMYKIDWKLSAHTGAGGATNIHGGVMIDDVAQRNDGEGHTHVSNANDDQSLGSPALVNCPNGSEEISLWVAAGNSQEVHVEHGTMMVMMIAGPSVIAPENIIFNAENVIFAGEQVAYP